MDGGPVPRLIYVQEVGQYRRRRGRRERRGRRCWCRCRCRCRRGCRRRRWRGDGCWGGGGCRGGRRRRKRGWRQGGNDSGGRQWFGLRLKRSRGRARQRQSPSRQKHDHQQENRRPCCYLSAQSVIFQSETNGSGGASRWLSVCGPDGEGQVEYGMRPFAGRQSGCHGEIPSVAQRQRAADIQPQP